MASSQEFTFEFRPCPRCRVDLPPEATCCPFCELVLVEQPAKSEPMLTRLRRRGQVVSQQKKWRAL